MTEGAKTIPTLLTFEQLAQHVYNVSVRRLRDMSKDPRFPKAIVLGPRTLRYARAEHEAYIASHPRQALDEPPQLAAARAAKAAGRTPAPAPFNGALA
jgi:predicted DNA-binding transcriptional regulator AlpA